MCRWQSVTFKFKGGGLGADEDASSTDSEGEQQIYDEIADRDEDDWADAKLDGVVKHLQNMEGP